jgi:uncharacterized membrane protein
MDRTSLVVRRIFAGGSIAWAAALAVATFAAAQPGRGAAAYLSTAAVYAIGSLVCHQLPSRSFFLWGRQMPVCARCVGIYGGAALVALAAFGARRFASRRPPSRRAAAASRALVYAALACVPTAATLVFEWTTGVAPSNPIRAAAGLVLGATLAALVLAPGGARPEVN